MNIDVFGKAMENAKKHRVIKVVTKEKIKSCSVSKPNYDTTKILK